MHQEADQRPACIVTGAAGGIGQALVAAFDRAGWHVLTSDLLPLSRPDHVVGNIGSCADPESTEGLRIIAAFRAMSNGRLKAIIHNAAHQVVCDSAALTGDDWQKTLSVNLLAPFWLTLAFTDELETNHGSMLAISSIHEKLTKPGFVAYATSKAALSGMVRALAVDLNGKVRCNAICPAAIATPMLRAGFDGRLEAFKQLEAHHPSGRIGLPDEVAQTALFMCSDAAGFMNGSCVDLSGGISARLHDPV